MTSKELKRLFAWLATVDLASIIGEADNEMGILCPSYFDPVRYPTGWPALASAASKVPVIAVAPDAALTEHQAEYRAAFAAVKAAGGWVIGYVHTDNGTRPEAEVRAQVTLWFKLYPGLVNGIFFDETPTDVVFIPPYQRLAAHVRSLFGGDCRLVFNHGTRMPKAWVEGIIGAIWVTSENARPDWQEAAQLVPSFAGEFAVLRYKFTQAQAMATIAAVSAARAKWAYCTSDVLANPWDTLPPYWDAMVAAIEAAR